MSVEERDFRTEGGLIDYPNLIPVRFLVKYDPPQIGFIYKRHRNDKLKHLFLVQLNNLIISGDAGKIAQALFAKYPAFFNRKVVAVRQVEALVNRILEFIQNMINEYNVSEERGSSISSSHREEASSKRDAFKKSGKR